MPPPIIRVEKLSKRYLIGHASQANRGVRHIVQDVFTAPFRRLRSGGATRAQTEEFWALRDVSFDVQPGEVLGIIGRNGAGKSTLLKILSRITEPTSGRVVLGGHVASLLEVGTGFHAELTGRENVYLNGAILGMSRVEIKKKFDEIVDFAEVEKFIDMPVKHYSSGMYVRLAFSVAAHLEPEILIVDEVLAVGDSAFQKKCLGKMKEVSTQQGRTVLFVSHNFNTVRHLCTRAIVMNQGQLDFDGTASAGVDHLLRLFEKGDAMPSSTVSYARRPDLKIWMSQASLFGTKSKSGTVLMGESVDLELTFESTLPIQELTAGFVIANLNGDVIINSDNVFLPYRPFPEPTTRGVVVCHLGVIPLLPGRYSVSIWLGRTEAATQLEMNSLTFEMVANDPWGTGHIPNEKTSLIWWPTTFDLQPR